jgi:uncharacterized protein YndB with AHSA1/START domain
MAPLKLVVEPGKHEIVTSREFHAPRDLVFKAFTDPTLIPKWWGPSRMTTTVDQMEVRMGGIWRYVLRDLEGLESAFHGVYHEILALERLVFTFEWEGMPGHVLLETVTFAARVRLPSVAADPLHPWMCLKPGSKGNRLPIR